jgi:hypothetical protein
MNAGPNRFGERLYQRENRASIQTQIGFEIEFAMPGKEGDTVIADGTHIVRPSDPSLASPPRKSVFQRPNRHTLLEYEERIAK